MSTGSGNKYASEASTTKPEEEEEEEEEEGAETHNAEQLERSQKASKKRRREQQIADGQVREAEREDSANGTEAETLAGWIEEFKAEAQKTAQDHGEEDEEARRRKQQRREAREKEKKDREKQAEAEIETAEQAEEEVEDEEKRRQKRRQEKEEKRKKKAAQQESTQLVAADDAEREKQRRHDYWTTLKKAIADADKDKTEKRRAQKEEKEKRMQEQQAVKEAKAQAKKDEQERLRKEREERRRRKQEQEQARKQAKELVLKERAEKRAWQEEEQGRKKAEREEQEAKALEETATKARLAAATRGDHRKPLQASNKRKWKEEGYDGRRLRNVPYTADDSKLLMECYRQWVKEHGFDYDTHTAELLQQRQSRQLKTYIQIAEMANLPFRSVQSVAKRLKRMLWGSVHWTEDMVEGLTKYGMEMMSRGRVLAWTEIAGIFGVSPEQCRDKWKDISNTGRKHCHWNEVESMALRKAIFKCTGKLVPTSDIPWSQVAKYVPHRSPRQCMSRWNILSLKLLSYRSEHGQAVEPEVFHRKIVRDLQEWYKQNKDEYYEKDVKMSERSVAWHLINAWWTPDMNRSAWNQLRRQLPYDGEDLSLRGRIKQMYDHLGVKKHKKTDVWLLNRAKIMEEEEQVAAIRAAEDELYYDEEDEEEFQDGAH